MNRWQAVAVLFVVLVLTIVILILALLPIVETTYMEEETYTDTETYIEKEPYTAFETYLEKEPYTALENYTDQEPYSVTQEFLYKVVGTGIENNKPPQSGGYAYVEIMNLEYGEGKGLFGVNFDVKLSGGAKWNSSDSDRIDDRETERLSVFYPNEQIADFDYEIYSIPKKEVILYRDVTKTREVTKYEDIEKQREVTKYNDIEKQREVLKTHEVEKTKRVSVFKSWFD